MLGVTLSTQLRRHLMSDPISHERGADPARKFRVDVLAHLCNVDADVIRSWALGWSEPSVWQKKIIERAMQKVA